MRKLLVWIGTGFGLGYSPFAPGTVGALWGLPLAWWINTQYPSPGVQAIATLICLAGALPLCQAVENHLKVKDPKPCVADEFLTYPLCLIGLPVVGQEGGLAMMAFAFLTHRFFDIAKIWPANGLQRLKGGVGILIDDVFASLYALAVNHAFYALARKMNWI